MFERALLSGLLATVLCSGAPALAGMDVRPADLGRDLARDQCGGCHAIAPSDTSPNAEAPPFDEIVKLYPPETLEEALAEGIMVGHEDMPAFVFSADQVEQLVAYLKSLE